MKQFIFPFFALLTVVFCPGAASDDTLELPKQCAPATPFKIEEIDINGQKRYRILTEHYDITAAKLEDGNRAGEQLEHLFSGWTLFFAEFVKEQETEPEKRLHRVILYRNQREYIANLQRIDPSIARSNGYYSSSRKTAYFFSTEAKILFHEGTHQILAEHFFHEKTPAFHNNFWVIEGIALFMQTLKVEDTCYKIGDILADRLYSAKEYRFKQNHHLPIQSLTAMSSAKIQSSTDLQKIYSQSATLVHWLMFAEAGRYRNALFELLRQTYRDSAKPETLSELTGLSYEELDKKYAEFLQTIPDEP